MKPPIRLRLHGCPRCGGAIYVDEDGAWRCLQCARTLPPPPPTEQGKEAA